MEQLPHLDQFQMSSLFRRLAAMLYDSLLLIAVWFLVGFIAVAINKGEAISTYNPLMMSALYIATFTFYAYFWTTKGQTLGMRAWRLRIVTQDGKPLTLTHCLLRFFISHFSFFLLGLGYWWSLFSPYKRSWHDQYSETAIIQYKK